MDDTDTQHGRGPRGDARAVVAAYEPLLDGVAAIEDVQATRHDDVADLLALLARAHALPICYDLVCRDGPRRFSELEAATGASPKVLSQRLDELTDAGLVRRHSYDEIPPRVEYEPTSKATDLTPAFQFLYGWADRHAGE